MDLELQNFVIKIKKKLINKIAKLEEEKINKELEILRIEAKLKELKEQLENEEFIKQEAQKSLERKRKKSFPFK